MGSPQPPHRITFVGQKRNTGIVVAEGGSDDDNDEYNNNNNNNNGNSIRRRLLSNYHNDDVITCPRASFAYCIVLLVLTIMFWSWDFAKEKPKYYGLDQNNNRFPSMSTRVIENAQPNI